MHENQLLSGEKLNFIQRAYFLREMCDFFVPFPTHIHTPGHWQLLNHTHALVFTVMAAAASCWHLQVFNWFQLSDNFYWAQMLCWTTSQVSWNLAFRHIGTRVNWIVIFFYRRRRTGKKHWSKWNSLAITLSFAKVLFYCLLLRMWDQEQDFDPDCKKIYTGFSWSLY